MDDVIHKPAPPFGGLRRYGDNVSRPRDDPQVCKSEGCVFFSHTERRARQRRCVARLEWVFILCGCAAQDRVIAVFDVREMGRVRSLNWSFKTLCDNHQDGSFATHNFRRRSLNLCANTLHSLGFKGIKNADNLKPKHVDALVAHWRQNDLAVATIKNRMADLRWVARVSGNDRFIRPENDAYGIPQRAFSTNEDRSVEFERDALDAIPDPHVRLAAELQAEFGLRREEAMKFCPSFADKGNLISLKGSWTKGGKPRDVPVRTESQRATLDRARALAGNGSMIPAHKSYATHLKLFERQMETVGLGRTHGARHLYAQNRFEELAGFKCPAKGGPTAKQLTDEQRERDQFARLTVSRELGHEREAITVVYLGR